MNTDPLSTTSNAPAPAWSKQLRRGMRYAQKGDRKRASEQFQAVLKADPRNADALHFLGVIMHQRGKSDQAITLIRRSLSVAPENPNAHNNLGNIFKETGENEKALECYRTALQHDPLNPSTLNNLGVQLLNQALYDEAIEVLEQATEINPNLAEAHHNLGKALARKGFIGPASEAYRRELDLSGDWIDPVGVAKIFIAKGDLPVAERLLEDYLKRHPNHVGAQFQLAAVRGENIEIANEEFVATHFDSFAASFDATLKSLDYRAPDLVAAAVAKHSGEPKADKEILDLGCGTGLCGPLIAAYKKRMVGIDLSVDMMVRAEKRDCYDVLSKAELQRFMEDQPPACVDIAVCVDTLVYIGALERTFAGAAHILIPNGLFIASVEALPDDAAEDYIVDPVGRFKHHGKYLKRLAAANNFDVLSLENVVLRQENKTDVQGFILSLRRP